MTRPAAEVRADFDRIATRGADDGESGGDYDAYLLRRLPRRLDEALEIGCGTGGFTRRLARRARRVTALDLSPEMIRVASERSVGFRNITYRVADVTRWEFPRERFDCVVSIATLHHLPLAATLESMSGALRPGGRLLVVDLLDCSGAGELLRNALALPYGWATRALRTRRLRRDPGARKAWDEHGRNDSYARFDELRGICGDTLPGARLRRHLLWRYSLIWDKR